MFPTDTRILIIDDLKTIRALMADCLKKLGFNNLAEAGDGKQGLELLKEAVTQNNPFGLIIADWNMPGMTGLELLEAKNKDENLKATPFLMVTIESERDYVLKAISLGVNDFVVKPFSEKTIGAKMKSIFDRLPAKKK